MNEFFNSMTWDKMLIHQIVKKLIITNEKNKNSDQQEYVRDKIETPIDVKRDINSN